MLQKYDEKVDDFLKGKLTESELEEFDLLMKEIPSIAEEVELRQQTQQAFAQIRHAQLKEQLQQLNPEKGKDIQMKSSVRWVWMAAASLLLLITLGIYFYVNNLNIHPQNLYAEYFEPYPNYVDPIERDISDLNEEKRAFLLYEQGNFEKAYQSFESLKTNPSVNSEIYFYQGLAAMESKYKDNVEDLIKTYMSMPNIRFEKQATWYLALHYLQVNEKSKSVLLLESLVAEKAYKAREANELLKVLR